MTNKVYIVTAGSYSDYHIEAVFATQEAADDYRSRFGAEGEVDMYVEVCDVGSDVPSWVGKFQWTIRMDRDGNVQYMNCFPYGSRDLVRRTNLDVIHDSGRVVCGTIAAVTKEEAIKITNEFRVRAIAEGKFDE